MEPKLFIATKALIFNKGKILLIRESGNYKDGTNAGKYDLIGGRLIPGQRFDESLKREVREETGLEITMEKPFHVSEWWPQVNGEQLQIVGIFFKCTSDSDRVVLSEDHDSYLWIEPRQYKEFSMTNGARSALDAYFSYGK